MSNNNNMNVKVIYYYASEGKLNAAGVKKISSSLPSFPHNWLNALKAFLQLLLKHQTLVTSEGSKNARLNKWEET